MSATTVLLVCAEQSGRQRVLGHLGSGHVDVYVALTGDPRRASGPSTPGVRSSRAVPARRPRHEHGVLLSFIVYDHRAPLIDTTSCALFYRVLVQYLVSIESRSTNTVLSCVHQGSSAIHHSSLTRAHPAPRRAQRSTVNAYRIALESRRTTDPLYTETSPPYHLPSRTAYVGIPTTLVHRIISIISIFVLTPQSPINTVSRTSMLVAWPTLQPSMQVASVHIPHTSIRLSHELRLADGFV